ncbi:hypothetical protein [Paraburkholderia sp. MPAMCS5]|uniref:hypothetical protein n=1 Tax=Paraburkholderia sp. MPAMCS5 TaxID=3112563 RepID=UPI003FA7C595
MDGVATSVAAACLTRLAAEVNVAKAHWADAFFSGTGGRDSAAWRRNVVGLTDVCLRHLLLRRDLCRLCMRGGRGQRAGNQDNIQHFHFVLQD